MWASLTGYEWEVQEEGWGAPLGEHADGMVIKLGQEHGPHLLGKYLLMTDHLRIQATNSHSLSFSSIIHTDIVMLGHLLKCTHFKIRKLNISNETLQGFLAMWGPKLWML